LGCGEGEELTFATALSLQGAWAVEGFSDYFLYMIAAP
jgi:hypothetical protein